MNLFLDSPVCTSPCLRRKAKWRQPHFVSATALINRVLIVGFLLISGLYDVRGESDVSSGFIPGEVLRYKVSWMGIPLAWSESTTDTIEENGRQLIRFRIVSKNYKAYSYIYKVDNVTEVIIDPETALPLRLDVILNEGTIHHSHVTTFFHAKKLAIFHDRISNVVKDVEIESRSQDIYSFLYSARSHDIESLAAREHTLFVDGKLYKLRLKIRKEGDVKLPGYGRVRCVEIEPIAEFDGLFLRKGKLFFWISKQKHRIITYIEAKVAVGRVKMKLQEASGTGERFWDKGG